jgi:Ca2+-binding RTX toxin-like protein
MENWYNQKNHSNKLTENQKSQQYMANFFFNLANLNGLNGFTINGINVNDQLGRSVSNAGDINGDGIDDLIVGANFANGGAGQSYVVFGRSTGFGSVLNLSGLNGTNGFAISGIAAGDQSGISVSSAGDVNGDGIDDLIVGAPFADFNGNNEIGQSYVVFGRSTGFGSVLNLSGLNGTNGFTINGINSGDQSGISVSSAGDVNGDGIDDLIVGANLAVPNGNADTGQSYVVFGRNSGFDPSLNLSGLNGTNGFAINGINSGDQSGISVSSAGDVNGDGIDDLIIGAFAASPNGNRSAGQSYVVFGSNSGFAPSLNLSSLNGTNGFAINGIASFDFLGRSVSNAGDVNGDGIDDLIVGANDPNGGAGQSYVVFGRNSGFAPSLDLSSLNGINGFAINGIAGVDQSGRSVSSAGDVNGDGIDDLIVGANLANGGAGQSYVVFGRNSGFAPSLNLSTLNGNNGFAINGLNSGDQSGVSVSGAGDVNNDGIDDLIVGAIGGNPNGNNDGGQSYVIYGNTAAQLDLNGSGAGINYTTNFSGNPVFASRQLTLTDNVNGITGATVKIVNPLNGAAEILTADVAGTGILVNYDSNTSTLTLTGSDTLANYQRILRSVTYDNNSLNPSQTNRTLEFVVTDAGAFNNVSTVATTTIRYSPNQNITGTSGADNINGLSGNDTLFGLGGNDTLFGGIGNDQLFGGADSDRLSGDDGSDRLNGDDGDDLLSGGNGLDTLTGGNGNDTLQGNRENDLLDGGIGFDTLIGGGESDRFVLRANNNTDTVTDFTNGQDLFFLTGNLTFGSLRISRSGDDTLINNASNNEVLAILTDVSPSVINAGDFTRV